MRSFIASALLSVSCGLSALADDAGPAGAIYVPEDFAQYAPLNARDMVERIPGFRLSDSRDQDESRGLGQATENVLINDQRVSSKSASAADVLQRIPANTVERIELLEGASLDIPGLSGLVVNVVAQASGVSGTWAYRARAVDGQGPLLLGGDLSVAGQNGAFGWATNISLEPRRSSGDGEEIVTDALGFPRDISRLIQNNEFPNEDASVALRWTPASGLIANLNAEYAYERRQGRESAGRTLSSTAIAEQRTLVRNESTTLELGGDVEFDTLAGRLKLIGVYSETDRPFTNQREQVDIFAAPLEDSRFHQQTNEAELILRGEYKWAALGGTWDASLETAENTLDSEAVLLRSTFGGPLTVVDLGDGPVSVEETRGEGFVTYSRPLGEAVQLQVSVGAEVSEIRSGGPAGQARQFTRPKGGVTLSWQFDQDTTVNGRIDREVGQLDFFDFVSQRDLNDGEDQVGNADIVPEQSWRAELEIERQFGAWGAGNVLVFAEALEDIVDQVPIGAGEGPGNIDSGSRYGVEFEGTLNFDSIGFTGAQLTYSAAFRDSVIEDPLTGIDREINGEELLAMEIEFRHDIAGTEIAWGGDVSPEREARRYRVDSTRAERELPGRASVFLEHKNLFGLTARAELFRPLGNVEKESRLRFTPDRRGVLDEIESVRVAEKPILILELSGTF